MYILKKSFTDGYAELSLREMLSCFLKENGILTSAMAEEIKIHEDTLSKYLEGRSELKLIQAIRIMKILGLTESQFVQAYFKDVDAVNELAFDRLERISYVAKNFDIPVLKKLGIIRARAKMDEYERCICSFLGISSIYEYDDVSLLPVLFSKSRRRVAEEKEAKMTDFWLRCAYRSFTAIGNPNEYDRNLLIQLVRKAPEFTADEVNGYYRFVWVLYQIGVTVLTQAYTPGTKAYGGAMIIEGKPCIVVTDMGKQYHKLWVSILHELHHVIADFDMLSSMTYHFSTPDTPDLLLNEQKADRFAYDMLVSPAIQNHLDRIIFFPSRVKALAGQLGVSPAIIYGVYLELLTDKEVKKTMFARLSKQGCLLSSDVVTRRIIFDPVGRKSLVEAIDRMKRQLLQKIV